MVLFCVHHHLDLPLHLVTLEVVEAEEEGAEAGHQPAEDHQEGRLADEEGGNGEAPDGQWRWLVTLAGIIAAAFISVVVDLADEAEVVVEEAREEVEGRGCGTRFRGVCRSRSSTFIFTTFFFSKERKDEGGDQRWKGPAPRKHPAADAVIVVTTNTVQL